MITYRARAVHVAGDGTFILDHRRYYLGGVFCGAPATVNGTPPHGLVAVCECGKHVRFPLHLEPGQLPPQAKVQEKKVIECERRACALRRRDRRAA